MKRDNLVYIEDIKKAILKIQEYIENIDFRQFESDDMRHDAVLRQLMIIGEAANKIDKEFLLGYPDFPRREANDLRNFLIHNYDDVDLEVVWKTIQEDLPQLKVSVDQILG